MLWWTGNVSTNFPLSAKGGLGGFGIPMIYYNRKLKNTARTLRKKMTDSEKLLWLRIRRKQLKGFQFYRQKVVGSYIVDFYCPSAKIIVEVDGGQHFQEIVKQRDKERDEYLSGLGFQVLRFLSWDVMKDVDRIVDEIGNRLNWSKSPSVPSQRPARLYVMLEAGGDPFGTFK
jgi:very-short-patch-repair endonuclease